MPKTNFAFFCRESTEKNGIIRIKKTRKVDKKVKASRKKAFFIGTEQALLSNNEETVQIIKTVNTTLNIKGVENFPKMLKNQQILIIETRISDIAKDFFIYFFVMIS